MYNVNIVGGSGTSSSAPLVSTPQQGTTSLNATPTTSAANAAAVVTLTGAAGSRITIRQITVFASVATTATVTVSDGATVVLNLGTLSLTTSGGANNFTGLAITGSAGNSMTVNIGAAGVGNTTTTSVIADRS